MLVVARADGEDADATGAGGGRGEFDGGAEVEVGERLTVRELPEDGGGGGHGLREFRVGALAPLEERREVEEELTFGEVGAAGAWARLGEGCELGGCGEGEVGIDAPLLLEAGDEFLDGLAVERGVVDAEPEIGVGVVREAGDDLEEGDIGGRGAV